MNVELLMKKLTAAITYSFPTDGTAPGLVLSSLKDGRSYASIVRYIGADKIVVKNAYGSCFKDCLLELARYVENLDKQKNPIDELRDFLQDD